MSGRIDSLGSDLRFAARIFSRAPGFTAIVILSLALGIGANTAVFSLVDAVMLKLLPVRDPEHLYFLSDAPKDNSGGKSLRRVATPFFKYADYKLIQERAASFEGFAVFRNTGRLSVSYQGQADVADGQIVSGNYFALLGVSSDLGQALEEPENTAPGANPVVVISYQYWQDRFGGDQSIVGQSININNTLFTIIGIAPSGFFGLEPGVTPQVWAPVSMKDQVTTGRDPGIQIVARLWPGSDARRAQAELDVIFDQILSDRTAARGGQSLSPDQREEILGRRIEMTPGGRGLRDLRDQIGDPVLIMMIIVALVLLIACANVATLILVKAGRRAKEFAIRISLGATRGRLIRQLVVESLLLTLGGGSLGFLLANWGVDSLLKLLATGPNPIKLSISPDMRLMAYTAAIMGLAVMLFGVVPALKVTRIDLAPALRENSAGSIGRKNRIGAGKILVVAQVALSLLLLVGAGLLVRSLVNIRSIELGIIPERVLLATMDAGLAGYKGRRALDLYREIGERIQRLPGVRSASASAFSPLGQVRGIAMVSVPGFVPAAGDEPVVSINRVSPDFFATLGIALLNGRAIDQSDVEGSPRIAVINEALANKYFRDQDPLGKVIDMRFVGGTRQVEVVGVVKDSKYSKVQEEISPTVYTPVFQGAEAGRMTFAIRAEADPRNLIPDLRRIVAEIDGNVPLFDVKTIEDQINESLVQQRLTATLSGFFGLLALLLACIGLFGVTSHEVSRRTNEIGVMMALGAAPGRVLRVVMQEAISLVLIGIVIGLPAAFLLTPLVSTLLFGLPAHDPTTFAVAAAVMLAPAAIAAYVPARRAARVDPVVAIRYE